MCKNTDYKRKGDNIYIAENVLLGGPHLVKPAIFLHFDAEP